jgi:hypothetical protein
MWWMGLSVYVLFSYYYAFRMLRRDFGVYHHSDLDACLHFLMFVGAPLYVWAFAPTHLLMRLVLLARFPAKLGRLIVGPKRDL